MNDVGNSQTENGTFSSERKSSVGASFSSLPSSVSKISVGLSSSSETMEFAMDEGKDRLIISKKDKNLMKLYSILSSTLFFVIVYSIAIIVHIILFTIFGGIELEHYKSKGEWLFMEGGYFEAAHGCAVNPKTLIVVGVLGGIYIFVFLVMNVLSILSDRDTYNIKIEEMIMCICLGSILILYIIFGSIPIITTLVDYFIPYPHVFVMYSFMELFFGVLLPVYYSLRDASKAGKSENNFENVIETLLNEKKAFEIISDFARRSYCIEDVLAWKEIQKFKKLRNRKQAALDFINNYLISGAPLELNIPNGHKVVKALQESLEKEEEPANNIFDELEFQCLFNMTDLLQRLKSRNEYIEKKLDS